MTKEDKLREYILKRYSSIREFTIEVGMPYSTVASVLKRGIDNSSISNVFRICRALGISTDALADGQIVPMITSLESPVYNITEVEDIVNNTKEILKRRPNLSINGEPVNIDQISPLMEAMDLGYELSKKKNSKGKA